ncbi:NACHT, LRR and PYD domains-containing protein 12-like [Oncorhynchus kisutch]|uniref:NACHT, LRR and PYD domains-containing protein 12-like n=1 Tax=Oncorhynchus kisutch TaxID=8019 RepID=A0A8C7IEN3_ONCKI|nr:NACHT, LRR and PYD domains-containing protein 12-like [Oncorhynchus kisutch]XP_020334767.1 NACHT, LRR and PYD domains-containing protein 12-like [Oncorhynchus kisutch]XP_020334821.1 NACHT, LRR and PYD domains-containing protein 12-like [Oncorhynchus kisutch]
MFRPGREKHQTEPREVSASHVAKLSNKLKAILKKKYQSPPGGETEHPFYIHCDLHYPPGESGEGNQHEYIQIEPTYRKRHQGTCSPIGLYFDSELGNEQVRIALTKGVSGIGKTSQVRMVILNWAEGKGNQECPLLFPLPFRELNLLKERLSLIELLHKFFPELKEPGISNLENFRIWLIFDGLDEFRRPLDFKNSPIVTNVTEASSVPTLLTNLINGNLLPSAAHIWITSRPAAVSRIPLQYINEVTEIEGFTDYQKEEFFRRAIHDKNQANAIIAYLKYSKSLYVLCQIPFICSICVLVLWRKTFLFNEECDPRALTPVYTDLLALLQTQNQNAQEMAINLGELAFKQLVKGNTVFYEEDLRECNIDARVAAVYAKVNIPIFREDIGLHQQKIYYFGHTTIQEFFAAMWFLQSCNSPDENLRKAVDMALQSKNGKLDLFLRFLLGFSQNFIQSIAEAGYNFSETLTEAVEYIKKKVMENPASPRTLNLLKCLTELGDSSLETDGVHFLKTGIPPDAKYPRAHWSDLASLLVASESGPIDMLGLEVKKRGDEELLRMLPVIKASQTAKLSYHNLTEIFCEGLASALTSKVCNLKALDLSFNTLKDSGVQLLAAGLAKPHCRLERLKLSGCRVKQDGFAALAKALKSNPSHLRELDLSGNEPGEAGVFHLVDGLKVVNCKLQILKLSNCKLGLEQSRSLAVLLIDNPRHLRELDVSMNDLGDRGVKLLMDILKSTQIYKLELYCCQLTEKCCENMFGCLVNIPSLRELNLSNNNLKDEGVKMLCNAFGLPACQLEKLIVASCGITLVRGFHFNSILKELDISRNHLGDSDDWADVLFCLSSLETLRLSDCKLTEKCFGVLVKALSSNLTNLKELDLSGNDLGDRGVKTLYMGLTSRCCTLERLFLRCCGITVKGCSSLALALKSSHSSITELGLMGNDTGEEGLRILSDIRDNQRYNLQTLEIND